MVWCGLLLPEKECLEKLLAKVVGDRKTLSEVLNSRELASLGDSYLNFAYSIARSLRDGRLRSLKISNSVLADAVRKAGLRSLLPRRLSRREIGGAAEALIAYAVAREAVRTGELVEKMVKDDIRQALAEILLEAVRRLSLGENNGS